MKIFAIPFLFFLSVDSFVVSASQAKRFGLFEASFESHGDYNNPYTDLEAVAEAKRPDGTSASIPLFWDGEKTWKLRISPETIGAWSFGIRSEDEGLNGKQGSFECIDSGLRGGIEIMEGHPHHFQRQDGAPFLFWGDTAWGLYLDKEEENLHRETAFHYIDKRANEGINALHSMLLSEAGWGNNGGAPFEDLQREEINPTYWQEVDLRLRYLNDRGIIGGLVVAWGDKGRGEIYSWRRFPSMDARKRYAQYIAARYSAYDVYFILSGEWHGEAYNWEDITEGEVKANFIEIGEVLAEADIHDRMIGMHPMNKEGSVRDFNEVTG